MKSFSSFKLEEAKATYTIKDSEGNIKHAGTDKDMAYKTHKSLNAKEAGHKLYKNGVATLAEVLNKDAKAGEWISDFIKSDNPKFAGKSEAKRKQMALAAYYAKQNESVDLEEASRAETGELFKSLLDRASKASEAGDHTQAKRHLANAQTARYGILAKHIPKHAANFDKYKELKNSYMHSEGTMQPNGTDKIQPDEGMSEGLCQVCGATDCKEHFYKSPAVTGYVKEETGEHHDYAHVKKTMKKVDFDTYAKHMSKHDADHSMENKHKVDTQHSGSYTGKIHGAEVSHKVSGSGQKEYYIKEETLDEISKETLGNYVHKSFARGNEIHKQLDKQVDGVQSPEERAKLKAELSKRNSGIIKAAQKMRNEELELNETTRHTVRVQVSDPRDDSGFKTRKAVSVLAASPKHAEKAAHKHFTDKGYKVHSVEVKKPVSEEVVKEATDTVKKDASGKVIAWSHEGDWEKNSTKKQGTGKAANLAGKALQKTKSLNKEEVDLEEGWEVFDTKTRAIHSSHPTQRKALNAMNKLNDKHPGYETPGDLIASKFGARVSKDIKEGTQTSPGEHFASQSPKMQDAINLHLRKGKSYQDAVDAARKHVKEEVQIDEAARTAWDVSHTADQASKLAKMKGGTSNAAGKDAHFKAGMAHHDAVLAHKAALKQAEKSGDHVAVGDHEDAIEHHEAESKKHSNLSESINESVWGKDKATNLRQAHDRHMEKALAANKAGDDEAVKTHQRKMQMIQGKLQKLKNNEEVELGEECEILSELSKKTLANYTQKAAHDVGNKMHSAGSDRGVAQVARLQDKDKLAKTFEKDAAKSHSKALTRLQGIKTATNKLTKEEVEEFMQTEAYDQLDELSKATLGSYVKKASEQGKKAAVSAGQSGQGLGIALASGNKHLASVHDDNIIYSNNLERKRKAGVSKAVDKLTKEDTMLTYSEFMAQLAESRADDLKDKLAADREARLNNYDYSKEKAAKKNPITKVKGHSYGAGDEDGEAEPAKAAEPAEKRGRGRPAGSKSGARA